MSSSSIQGSVLGLVLVVHAVIITQRGAAAAATVGGIETIPSNKATLETMTGPGRWYGVDFSDYSDGPRGLVCGDGQTPFSILFKRASTADTSTKWLIEFEGGRTPTCWMKDGDGSTSSCCSVTPDSLRPSWSGRTTSTTTSSTSTAGTEFTVLDDISVCEGWSQGLVEDDVQRLFEVDSASLDLPLPLRPVDSTMNGDWWQGSIQHEFNYVLVPDCTADAGLGMNTNAIQYDNSGCESESDTVTTNLAVYHRGGLNRRAVIDWIGKASSSLTLNDGRSSIDALVTVAGGRPLEGGGRCDDDKSSSISSIAPLLATAQAVTTLGLEIETLTIQDGIGLFPITTTSNDGQRLPTHTEMQQSWSIEEDEVFSEAFVGTGDGLFDQDTTMSSSLGIEETATRLATSLVSSTAADGVSRPNTVVWIASASNSDQITWLDSLVEQGLPVYVYQTQQTERQESSCPRFAFPTMSTSFSNFLTTQVTWNPEIKSSTLTSSGAVSSSMSLEGEDDGRKRLTFLTVVLIIVGIVVMMYIGYFALRRQRLDRNEKPPPSPVDLWFNALTEYPGIFLCVSILIPIILSVVVVVQNDGQINVNLDFDSYLEINTPLENTRRVYEWRQSQQRESREIEENNCAYIDSTENFPNRLLSVHDQSHDHDINVQFEHIDLAQAVDWEFLLQHIDLDADLDEHQRKLDMANLLYYSGGEVISIMYTNPRGGNVFEPSVLEEIFRFEQSIYNFPGFVNYCFGFAGVRCLPIDSLVSHFFTSSGSLKTTDTETITRSFLGNQPALWKLDQFFGPDNLGSNVTRSFVFLRNVGGDQSAARPFLERFYRDFLWKNQGRYNNMVYTWDNHYLQDLEGQDALRHDSLWSIGSLCFIALMIAFKVRNTFVTLVAMSSLILSFFAAYYWVAAHFAIQNATLLWVAGLFVMLGIGADDIFLMIDSFEHAKITDGIDDNNDESNELDNAQVEAIREVVIKAYRQAGGMMLVSSVTTAVCFFSNAFGILVVIQEFGIFMGMVVLINYIHVMTILPSALLVDVFYGKPIRRRFQRWFTSKFGIGRKTSSNSASSMEERDIRDNLERTTNAASCRSAADDHDCIPDPATMNRLDRFLVTKYSRALGRRRLLVVASCVVLAMALGILGYFNFFVAGDIVLFSGKYNLGRLTIINDLYFNSDIAKTIEENKAENNPSQVPASSPAQTPQGPSSSSSDNVGGSAAAPLPESITGGGVSANGSVGSGSGSGGAASSPQEPVGNVQQPPPSETVTGNTDEDDSNIFGGSVGVVVGSGSSSGSATGGESSTTNSQSSSATSPSAGGQSSAPAPVPAPVYVGGSTLLGSSGKDLKRVEAINMNLVWGVEPPAGTRASGIWTLQAGDSRSIGIHGGLQNAISSIDASSPEVQLLLFNTISRARSDPSLHLLSKLTWIEILHNYVTSDPYLDDFPIPQSKFESYIQRLQRLDEEFASQIDRNLGTVSPGTAGKYSFVGLSIQVDAIASLDGSPSTALSEIVYHKFTRFASSVNAEASAQGDLPTMVVLSSVFLDAYRVEATIESTVLSWIIANGLCFVIILVFTHNVALSFMVMTTITLILLCLNGLLFGIAKLPFGPVEALGVSIFVGLSANYSLHVVHAYQHSKAKNQSLKSQYAIYAVGSPIVASALSTMGASAFLFGCRTWVFIELGILLLCVTSMALLYSMTFLLAWLSLAGPRPYVTQQGKMVHRWDVREWIISCVRRKSLTQARVETKDQCLELATAVSKNPPGPSCSAGKVGSVGSLLTTQISTECSSSVRSSSSSSQMLKNYNCGDEDHDLNQEEDDDYSIEVTSDDEE